MTSRLEAKLKAWITSKVISPVNEVLRGGIKQHKLAISFCCGFVGGVLPLPGLTFLSAFLLGIIFSANVVIVQVCNLLATPLNIATIFPFMNLGRWIVDGEHFSFDVKEFSLAQITKFSRPIGYGLVGYFVICPFLLLILYPIFYYISKKMMLKMKKSIQMRPLPEDKELRKIQKDDLAEIAREKKA